MFDVHFFQSVLGKNKLALMPNHPSSTVSTSTLTVPLL